MIKCDHCGSHEVKVHFNGEVESKHLCMDCYNQYMSGVLGVELEPIIESFY
ncbi:DUF7685 domain-containing protein [Bacillus dakarensis]|uniref:DUF7685 domain-containing protein n=1 Tax=Robertmurraya dakarensis TaxID=1926278 RepID=UPI003B01721F